MDIFASFGNWIVHIIRYHRSWSIQALVFMTVICYVGGLTFKYYLDIGESIMYAVARACGAILKVVLMPAIIPPTSRVIYTEIRNSKIGKFLGLDRRIADHKLFAIAASVIAIIHMVSHYIYNCDNFSKQPGITGAIMLASLALPLAGVFICRWCIPSINKFSYSTQILRPHQLGAMVFILAYAYHTTDGRLIWYACAMYGVYLMDRILERFWYRYHSRIKKAVKIDCTEFIILTVDKPIGFPTNLPGQFCMLSFPEIDADLECAHPFTIITNTSDSLTFLIQKTGKWTTGLYNLINEEQTGKGLKIVVVGPFGSTLNCFYRHKSISFIGTGIGITPFISFLEYNFNEGIVMPFIEMHISQRNFMNFIPCFQTLNNVDDVNLSRLSVHLYLTGNINVKWLKNEIDQINTHHCRTKMILNVGTERQINIQMNKYDKKKLLVIMVHLCRPNLDDIVNKCDAVAVCGSHDVTNKVTDIAIKNLKMCYTETY